MSLIVQKFGGTSVADPEKIIAAARKAIRARNEGHQVVMVVSAMGKNTDMLVDLAKQITKRPSAREMDMLLSTGEQVTVSLMAMAIHSLGYEAVSLTGAQIGIVTDSSHTKARIKSISTERMERLLDEGKIIIAAGFQGVDDEMNITTLGRGGSDTTAVALAAVLRANSCEIHTDVDGVYTTDPRVVPVARRTQRISYDEMLELASVGSGVMHSRSIEFAKKFDVPVHVRSSFSDAPGTMIVADPESVTSPVCGAALAKSEARISVQEVPDRPGAVLSLFSKISKEKIAVDMLVQNVADDGKANISFTVQEGELEQTREIVEQYVAEVGAGGYTCDMNVAKVSIVGLGMATQSGVAQKMFRALADRNINISMITTSEIKISVLVDEEDAIDALRAVHAAFQLCKDPEDRKATPDGPSATCGGVSHSAMSPVETVSIVARLGGMEDLLIDDLRLDETQARITMRNIPDQPGLAATVFEEVAAKTIFVDMIVQSAGDEQKADISFTVPREDVKQAMAVAISLAERYEAPEPTKADAVAKLSVLGTGMKSNTDVATRMFQSLAEAGINVNMIGTSEVRINIVVDGDLGGKALETIRAEFQDVIL
jgi:aspartate kinase